MHGDHVVNLTWDAKAGCQSYVVYSSKTAPVTTDSTSAAASGVSFSHTSLVNGQKYSYAVSAVCGGVETPLSTAVAETPRVFLSIPYGSSDYTGFPYSYANNAVAKTPGGGLFVGSHAGVSFTSDLGQTFRTYTTANGLPSMYVMSVAYSVGSGGAGGRLFAGTDLGLAFSDDGGASFSVKTTAKDALDADINIDHIKSMAAEGDNLFFLFEKNVCRSVDRGETITCMKVPCGGINGQGYLIAADGDK